MTCTSGGDIDQIRHHVVREGCGVPLLTPSDFWVERSSFGLFQDGNEICPHVLSVIYVPLQTFRSDIRLVHSVLMPSVEGILPPLNKYSGSPATNH